MRPTLRVACVVLSVTLTVPWARAGSDIATPGPGEFGDFLYRPNEISRFFPGRSCDEAATVRYDVWRAADETGRAALVFDILCAKDLPGRTRAEVEKRLGPPDVTWRDSVIYRLRPEPPWEPPIPPPPPPPPYSLVPGRYELWVAFRDNGVAASVFLAESLEPVPPDAVVRPEAARKTP